MYFYKYFAKSAVYLYFISLFLVCVIHYNYSLKWYWIIMGVIEVSCFFYFSNLLSKKWINCSSKVFERNIFCIAFIIRILVVIFLYFFYNTMTGKPFMFSAADSEAYHKGAVWIAESIKNGNFQPYLWMFGGDKGVSDAGYVNWLLFQYIFTNGNIFIARVLKALLSAYSCVLIYRLSKRNFGEDIGKMSAIFMMLMPNLIIYTGNHLKETEMIFLVIAFVERADYLIRYHSFKLKNIFIVLALILILFTFRTVLGICAILSIFISLLMSSNNIISTGRKWTISIIISLLLIITIGGRISKEIGVYWDGRESNQSARLEERISRTGNDLLKYAGAAVFAPMILTLPFPTMIETPGQEQFRLLHGGLFVKNIMSFFCILSIFFLLKSGAWRNNVLLGSFLILYLLILAVSAFAHSERFHLPSIPFEMIFAAVGVACMTNKTKKYFNYWSVFMLIAIIAWTWFKAYSRGFV